MSEYTPTTDEMRSMILEFGELIAVSRHEPEYRDRLITEFDRWLAQVKAEAWDEGHNTPHLPEFMDYQFTAVNPYREETE